MKLTDSRHSVAMIYVKGIDEVERPLGLVVEDWYEEFGDYELRLPITNAEKELKLLCEFLQSLGIDCSLDELKKFSYIILFS
jgi:hypothetical protein